MNRIDATLQRLSQRGETAFIGLAPISPRSMEESIATGRMLVDAGVDILMFHMPNWMPWMEGTVLQTAAKLPRQAGVSRRDMFSFAGAMRKLYPELPLIAMTLYDTAMTMGVDEFLRLSEEADIDGFDLPNYPLSYLGDAPGFYRRTLEMERHLILAISYELATAAEGTREYELLCEMIENSRGFAFVMNAPGGQSGSSVKLSEAELAAAVGRVQSLFKKAGNPSAVAVVCGISGPEDIRKVRKAGAESFMIGSAYIKDLLEGKSLEEVAGYIRGIKALTLAGGAP